MPQTRAIVYIRQSTYREESVSAELQETACRTYAAQQGYEVVGVVEDLGISGRTFKRPGIAKVMASIAAKEAEVILLWKWSRLSRSRLDWAVAADKVENVGGRIESATEPMDVSTSTGRLGRGIMNEFAAFESERIGDVWKETHLRRVTSGRPASGRARFGYNYTKEDGFVPDPVDGPILAEMYRRYISGHSITAIVKWANDGPSRPVQGYGPGSDGFWGDRTMRRMLDSGFGAGYIIYRTERRDGIHEPVISKEEFEEYLVRRAQRRTNRRTETSEFLLSGMIRCACGSAMTGARSKGDYSSKSSYRCRKAVEKNAHKGGYANTGFVERKVFEWLGELAEEINARAEAHTTGRKLRAVQNPTEKYEKEIARVNSRIDVLTNKFLDGTIPQESYTRVSGDLQTQKEILESQLRSVKVERVNPSAAMVPDLLANWERLSVPVRRDILSRLIDTVVVKPGKPQAVVTVIPRWAPTANRDQSSASLVSNVWFLEMEAPLGISDGG